MAEQQVSGWQPLVGHRGPSAPGEREAIRKRGLTLLGALDATADRSAAELDASRRTIAAL